MAEIVRIWPKEVATIGAMHRHQVIVKAICWRCKGVFKVDLPTLILAHGPRYSLIDRLGKCRRFDCDGTCNFLYRLRNSTHPFRPLLER